MKTTLIRKSINAAMAAGLLWVWTASLQAGSTWPSEAYRAEKIDDALVRLYQDSNLRASDAIEIKMPTIAENGTVVPITVTTSLPGVEAISILAKNNPFPLAAQFSGRHQQVSTRMKLRESSPILAVVKAGGKLYMANKKVKVTIGGCGGSSDTTTPGMRGNVAPSVANSGNLTRIKDTIKLRTQTKDGINQVKMLISHPMETGLRKDKAGRPIPAHFIKEVVGRHNGEVVFRADWGIAVSKNPYLSFDVEQLNKGDKIEVQWIDNKNRTDRAELVI